MAGWERAAAPPSGRGLVGGGAPMQRGGQPRTRPIAAPRGPHSPPHPATMRRQIALQLLRSLGAPAAAEPAWVQASNAALRAPTTLLARRGYADDADLKKTPLYDFHVEHGGAWAALHRPLARHPPPPRVHARAPARA